MSYSKLCEFCEKIGEWFCNCSYPPRFCCNDHIDSNTKVSHSLQKTSVSLSEQDIKLLKQAVPICQKEIIRQAILQRDNIINSLLQKIRKVNQEYNSFIERTLNVEIKQAVEQLVSEMSVPVYSSSIILNTLVSLKKTNTFSISNISKQISSLFLESPIFSSQNEAEIEADPEWQLSHEIEAHTGNIYLESIGDNEITCIAVSDCNKYFASASIDKSIKIWDARSCSLLGHLQGHTHIVTSVAFLENKIVSGSVDKTIRIWENDDCKNILCLHSLRVTSVCLSSSKRLIASGSYDTTVRIFDLQCDKSLHTLRSHTGWVTTVAFSENDREIFSGSFDGSIKVWKTETGELLNTINAHNGAVLCVRISVKLIVSSYSDRSIRVGERDREESLICFREHTNQPTTVDVCNRTVVSISIDNSISVWDLENGQLIQILDGHRSSGNLYGAALSRWYVGSLKLIEEGCCIISGGRDGKIKLWKRSN